MSGLKAIYFNILNIIIKCRHLYEESLNCVFSPESIKYLVQNNCTNVLLSDLIVKEFNTNIENFNYLVTVYLLLDQLMFTKNDKSINLLNEICDVFENAIASFKQYNVESEYDSDIFDDFINKYIEKLNANLYSLDIID